MEWDKIWSMNKSIIDVVAPRHTAVATAGKVLLTLSGTASDREMVTAQAHPKNPDVGKKCVVRSRGISIGYPN
jgi:hypothetical protein